MIDKNSFIALSLELYPKLTEIRQHLHSYPELSFEEYTTSKYIKSLLSKWNISYSEGWLNTGIVAEIIGEKEASDRVVAIRADIDALPITEENETSYKSKNIGCMHACGHDVHTTSALGAAFMLYTLREHWSGRVRIVFQPGEEKLPGGAKGMLKEGALGMPLPESIIALHVEPTMKVGELGFKAGKYMASGDEVYITITGEGGHAAAPDKHADTVSIAAHLIVELQQIVSRLCPPSVPTVLTFGKLIAGGATNVIPAKVSIEGTYRTFDEEWRRKAHQHIEDIAAAKAKAFGVSIDVNIVGGYPVLNNDKTLTKRVKKSAQDLLGKAAIHELGIRMSAEDFSEYSQHMPSCFFRLGVRNETKGIIHPVHHPRFDADEEAVRYGALSLAYFTFSQLNR